MDDQQMDQRQLVMVPAKNFGSKFQSKRELYRFISNDAGIFVPE